MEIAPEHEYLRETLKCMTGKLEAATAKVAEAGSTEYTDFHARRLVEMAGYTHYRLPVAAGCTEMR